MKIQNPKAPVFLNQMPWNFQDIFSGVFAENCMWQNFDLGLKFLKKKIENIYFEKNGDVLKKGCFLDEKLFWGKFSA